MASYLTFHDFRQRISIVEIAERIGYWKYAKGGNNKPTYRLGDRDNPSDEIVIYYPFDPGRSTYFSRNRDIADKGNLINFIFHRLDMFPNCTQTGYAGVNEVLLNYLGESGGNFIKRPVSGDIPKTFDLRNYEFSPAKISDIRFIMNIRRLSEQTVQDFISIFSVYKVKKNSHRHYNIGFPYRKPGRMDITNFELRNYNSQTRTGFKAFCEGGNKSESVWIANFCAYEDITDIYIFESAIDAMSFYELSGFEKQNTCAFVSIGGNIVQKQISGLIKTFPSVRYHFCFDNDVAGNIYDICGAYYLNGINCKGYKNPQMETVSFDFEDARKEVFHLDNNFSSKTYLATKELDIIPEIIKPLHSRKDFNEYLIYKKRITTWSE